MEENKYTTAVKMLHERIERMKQTISKQQSEANQEKETLPISTETVPNVETRPLQTFIQVFSSKKAELKYYITKILSSGQQSTAQLKKQIVDRDHKCSKASFYRYIQELKREQQITIIKIAETEYCVLLKK